MSNSQLLIIFGSFLMFTGFVVYVTSEHEAKINEKNKIIYEKEYPIYLEALKECTIKIGMEHCRNIRTYFWPSDEEKYNRDIAIGECLKNLDINKCELIWKWN